MDSLISNRKYWKVLQEITKSSSDDIQVDNTKINGNIERLGGMINEFREQLKEIDMVLMDSPGIKDLKSRLEQAENNNKTLKEENEKLKTDLDKANGFVKTLAKENDDMKKNIKERTKKEIEPLKNIDSSDPTCQQLIKDITNCTTNSFSVPSKSNY